MIDKQGKLFGKINIIDLIILLAILLLVVGFLYREKGSPLVSPPKTVKMQVLCQFVYPNIAENLKVGNQLVANGEPISAYIKKIEVKPALTTVTMPDARMLLTTNPLRKDIFIEVEGQTTNVTPGKITLGSQEVRVGKDDYYIKTQTVELKATILKVKVK